MSNFCVDLENERFFVYEKTLESDYMQGRFGAIPRIQGGPRYRSQFFHTPMKVVEPAKLAEELRKFADKLERGDIS